MAKKSQPAKTTERKRKSAIGQLSNAEALKIANDTFNRLFSNPQDGNARIIRAYESLVGH